MNELIEPNHKCWHLIRLDENQTLKKMVKEKIIECPSEIFCDHRIPINDPYFGIERLDISCPYDTPAECPIVRKEATKK